VILSGRLKKGRQEKLQLPQKRAANFTYIFIYGLFSYTVSRMRDDQFWISGNEVNKSCHGTFESAILANGWMNWGKPHKTSELSQNSQCP